MTMGLFILKILLAHLVGDCVLQPRKWVEDRSKNGYKSKYLYGHIAVHFLLLILFFVTELQAVFGYIVLITVSHFLIDLGKIYVERTNRFSPLGLFITDQLLRSEEHTSELQSRENLVCRLLLEKKKN